MLLWTAAAGALALLATQVDRPALLGALRGADLGLLAAAAAVNLALCMGAMTARLRGLLAPLPRPGGPLSLGATASLQFACAAAFNLLPTPGGDLVRSAQLVRLGYRLGAVVAAQLVERVIEALALALITLAVAASGRLPAPLQRPLFSFAAVALAGAVALLVLGWRWSPAPASAAAPPATGLRGHLRHFLARLGEAMHLLRRPRTWAAALGWSLVCDGAHAASIGLAAAAVGLALDPPTWLLVMLVSRLVGVLPSTPGQVGVVEGGVVLLLTALGIDRSAAFAFALLYHAAHWLPVTLIGIVELRRLGGGEEPPSTDADSPSGR